LRSQKERRALQTEKYWRHMMRTPGFLSRMDHGDHRCKPGAQGAIIIKVSQTQLRNEGGTYFVRFASRRSRHLPRLPPSYGRVANLQIFVRGMESGEFRQDRLLCVQGAQLDFQMSLGPLHAGGFQQWEPSISGFGREGREN
jgi:hypothetical protein